MIKSLFGAFKPKDTAEHAVPSSAISQRTIVGGGTTEPTEINGRTLPATKNAKPSHTGTLDFNLISAIAENGERVIQERIDELDTIKKRQEVLTKEIDTYRKLLAIANEHATMT